MESILPELRQVQHCEDDFRRPREAYWNLLIFEVMRDTSRANPDDSNQKGCRVKSRRTND